jgi:hypothetical protein
MGGLIRLYAWVWYYLVLLPVHSLRLTQIRQAQELVTAGVLQGVEADLERLVGIIAQVERAEEMVAGAELELFVSQQIVQQALVATLQSMTDRFDRAEPDLHSTEPEEVSAAQQEPVRVRA